MTSFNKDRKIHSKAHMKSQKSLITKAILKMNKEGSIAFPDFKIYISSQ